MGKFVYFTSAEKRQANEVDLFLRIDQAYGKKNSQPTQVPVAERRSPYSAMGLYNEDAKT